MTTYLFDRDGVLRTALAEDEVVDLIHDEGNYTLTAVFAASVEVETGEYIGFACTDGKYRMFCAEECAYRDDKKTLEVHATDRAVIELSESIIEEVQVLDKPVAEALAAYVPEGWQITGGDAERAEKSRAYFTSAWTMCKTLEALYECRIVPHYTFGAAGITGRAIAIEDSTPQWRGRVLNSNQDAQNVCVTSSGRPITRLYGIGPATNSGDVQTNMTFDKVVWSKADGDPADKPSAQCWVEDAEAVAKYGVHAAVVYITDLTGEEGKDKQADLLKKTWEQLQTLNKPSVRAEANLTDLELIPDAGKVPSVRVGDLVGIRLDNGEWVEAKVTSIKRNYARPWLSKITVGDKAATITNQVSGLIASATHTFERLTIYQNRFHEDETLIQLNAEYIQANADRIDLFAGELGKANIRIDGVEDTISAQAKEITLKADKVTVDALETVVNGKVSTEELNAKISDLETSYSDYIITKEVDAGTAEVGTLIVTGSAAIPDASCGTLGVDGTNAAWKTKTIVTGVKVTTATAEVMSSLGKAMTIMYVAGVTPTYDTIKYLGAEGA